MSVIDCRNVADNGGGELAAYRHRLQLCVRTGTGALRKGAANLLAFSALCLLATIASVAAQAVAAPVILINRNSGQCVTIPNGSSQPGLQMVQLPCRGPLDEQWTLQAVPGGYYKIVSLFNGLCLEVAGASLSDNAAVQQATCTNSPSKSWKKKVSGSWF
jgi:hypothetical protein